ncbi:alkaline phosphatase family protein [Pseudomonas sp.]|uniref:alkaline phosphatase family protein n=1 Tax=Pseudomonas sp. TaxID=306 RepID=UPI0028A74C8A|nr:alkaline phosphatase family protein [Pseudomonas sp.]
MSLFDVLRWSKPAVAAGLLLSLIAGCDTEAPPRQPKTLLIGISGVQLQHYEQLGSNTTLQQRLFYGKAYTGGITARASDQPTISGPGWITLLTGVWANKHTVTSDAAVQRLDPHYPSLFRRLREAMPNAYLASIVHWPELHTAFLLEDAHGNDMRESGLSDDQVEARALQVLDYSSADFTFVQFAEADQIGQKSGFGPAYQAALRRTDEQLGRLLDKVEQRARSQPREDWLVLVSTDHGRDYWGKGSGGVTEQEKTVFIASNKPLNSELSQPQIPHENPGPGNLYSYAAQTSVAPTVLRHMGLSLLPQWQLDGVPLLGDTGVRKARAVEGEAKLLWSSQSHGTVEIYKDGQVVASVRADRQEWTDPQGMSQAADYVLALEGVPVAVRTATSEPLVIEDVSY